MRWTVLTMSAAFVLAGCASDSDMGGSEGADEAGTQTGTDTGGETGESGSGDEIGTDGETETDVGTSETDGGTGETDTGTGDTSDTTGPPDPFCGDGNVDPGEDCDDGNQNEFDGCLPDCTSVDPIEAPALEWEYFEIPGTQCMNGDPAGFAVNENPDSSNVMIYLEGGGACFSDACDFTAFNIPFIPPIDGIFSRSNNNNPVKDWTMIYVPYCTGDIHAGDAEAELGGQIRQFRGYSNIHTYLQKWVPSFPADRVLLTGISAGGFGAALNARQVADAYGPGVELTVIDDSGPPLSNEVIPPCLQTLFRETWNLDNTVLAGCDSCDPNDFATGLIDEVLTNYPDVRFGLFSNTGDAIIRGYMGAGWGNGQYDNCGGLSTSVPFQTYAGDLDDIRAAYMDRASSFYVTGIGHTVLRVSYNITIVDGTSVPEWVGQVLDGQIVHVGP